MRAKENQRPPRGGSRGRVQGVRTLPPPPRDDLRFSNTTGIPQKKKTMWFNGVEVEQETSAPSPEKKSWIRPCHLLSEKSPRLTRRERKVQSNPVNI